MKWFLILAMLVLSMSASAAQKFSCSISQNLRVIDTTTVSVTEGQKNISFGNYEEFEFFLSSLGGDKFELQALNKMEPSRSYATGHMNAGSRELELSLWTREFLLETTCSLTNE